VGRARENELPKRRFAVSGFSVSSRDSESQMRATLAVSAEKPDEIRSEFVARKNQAANKAPEPTPGLVTSRAEMASEMISSGRARLAPSPVVAHL